MHLSRRFCLALALACITAAGRSLATPAPVTTQATTQPSTQASTQPATRPTLAFPTWGVELTPPPGWGQTAEKDLTVMAQWVPRDGSPGTITIVCTPMLQRTLAGAAQQIANMVGGKIDETKLDGRLARRVTGGRSGEAALFAERAGYLYEIRYVHDPANPAEFEALRTGWRWTELEPPAKHPEMRRDLIPVLDQFVVQLPTHMRPWAVPPAPGTANFAAIDIIGQRIRQEFFVAITMPASIQGKPLNELATLVSDPLQKQMGMKNPIAWRLIAGKNDRIISQTILQPTPTNRPDIKPRYGTCAGIVALDGQRRVFVNFIANTEDGDKRSAFMSMGENILGSILPIEAVMPGHTPTPVPAAPAAPPGPAPATPPSTQ